MKESRFIRQNEGKWEQFEKDLIAKKQDPQKISKLFVEVTDDLAYSQTFYHNRSVRVYLNGIGQLLFNDINKNNRIRLSSLVHFWSVGLPITIYKSRKELIISFLFFILSMGIGVFSSMEESEFARTILGDRYVNMTLENIHNDDPMAVYKDTGQGIMFLQITYNNILVSLRTFIFGLFFGIGSLLSMLHNGIMVGTFQYFFVEKGLFRESALTIWQHGTLEIASIIIAGGAGLVLGKGLIFPGTYTRFQALRISARRGIKIMIGIIPIFILAAFIESYFTRHTDIGDFYRALSILLSLTFVVGYFVIYPWIVSRRYAELIDISETLNENIDQKPDYTAIHTTDQIFGLSFALFRKYFKQILISIVSIAIVTGGMVAIFSERILTINEVFAYDIRTYRMLFLYNEYPLMFFVNTLAISMVLLSSVFVVYVNYNGITYTLKSFLKYFIRQIVNTLIISGLINFLFFIGVGWAIFILFFLMPVVYLTLSVDVFQRKFSLAAIPEAFSLMRFHMQHIIVNYFKFSCILVVMVVLANPAYYNRFIEAVNWSLYLPEHLSVYLLNFLLLFIIYFAISLWTVLTGISFSMHYFSMTEAHSAKNLLERVNQINSSQ